MGRRIGACWIPETTSSIAPTQWLSILLKRLHSLLAHGSVCCFQRMADLIFGEYILVLNWYYLNLDDSNGNTLTSLTGSNTNTYACDFEKRLCSLCSVTLSGIVLLFFGAVLFGLWAYVLPSNRPPKEERLLKTFYLHRDAYYYLNT